VLPSRAGDKSVWRWRARNGCATVSFSAAMSAADGRILFDVAVSASAASDFMPRSKPYSVSVVVPFSSKSVPFMAGLGAKAGARRAVEWRWRASRPLDAAKGSPPGMGARGSCWDHYAWLGGVDLGAKLRLSGDRARTSDDDDELLFDDRDGAQFNWKLAPDEFPKGWSNGGIKLEEDATLTAFTGAVQGPVALRCDLRHAEDP
jgi:hypothetical protein